MKRENESGRQRVGDREREVARAEKTEGVREREIERDIG